MAESRDSMGAVVPLSSGMPAVEAQLSRLATDAALMGFGMPLTAPLWAIQRAKALLPAIDAAMQGAAHSARVTILERLADQTIAPDALKSGDVKRIAAFWGAFHTDLANVPAPVLSRACGTWRRSGEKFYPTSGQLLKLCRDDEEWSAATTLRKGLDRIANATPERGDNYHLTDEESLALFREKLAALGKRVRAEHEEISLAEAGRAEEIAAMGSLLRRVPAGDAA